MRELVRRLLCCMKSDLLPNRRKIFVEQKQTRGGRARGLKGGDNLKVEKVPTSCFWGCELTVASRSGAGPEDSREGQYRGWAFGRKVFKGGGGC